MIQQQRESKEEEAEEEEASRGLVAKGTKRQVSKARGDGPSGRRQLEPMSGVIRWDIWSKHSQPLCFRWAHTQTDTHTAARRHFGG